MNEIELSTYIEKLKSEFINDEIGQKLIQLLLKFQSKEKEIKSLKEKLHNLKILYDIGKSISSELELKNLLEKIVDSSIKITKASRGVIILGESVNNIEFFIAKDSQGQSLDISKLRISGSVIEQVYESKKPFHSHYLSQDKIFAFKTSIIDLNINSVLAVPIISRGNIIGIIYVDSTYTREPFSLDELMMLEALANHSAIAIENAQLYQDLQQKTLEKERAERLASLGKIASGIAHEIRNPLAIINTATYFLESTDESNDPERFQQYKIIKEEIKRANKIIDDLLGFARGIKINPEPIDLVQFIFNILEKLKNTSLLSKFKIYFYYDVKEIVVNADKFKLEEVLLNLIRNSAEHSKDKFIIVINLRLKDNYALISIKDYGEGIKKEHLSKIFDPFFTTKTKGTGLGLSLCYTIIKQHGGSITAHNNPEGGAIFTIKLPVYEKK